MNCPYVFGRTPERGKRCEISANLPSDGEPGRKGGKVAAVDRKRLLQQLNQRPGQPRRSVRRCLQVLCLMRARQRSLRPAAFLRTAETCSVCANRSICLHVSTIPLRLINGLIASFLQQFKQHILITAPLCWRVSFLQIHKF